MSIYYCFFVLILLVLYMYSERYRSQVMLAAVPPIDLHL